MAAAKKVKKQLVVPIASEETLEELRSKDAAVRANALVDLLGNTLPAIPESFQYRLSDADRVKNSFDFAFVLMGGVPSFALWAVQNPDKFYPLYTKMLPAAANVLNSNGPLTIITNVPDSDLDNAKPVIIDVGREDF